MTDRSMIFDAQGKQNVAQFFNLPLDTYMEYNFEDWMLAKKRLTAYLDQMSENIQYVNAHLDREFNRSPMSQWVTEFEAWAKVTGMETVKPYLVQE